MRWLWRAGMGRDVRRGASAGCSAQGGLRTSSSSTISSCQTTFTSPAGSPAAAGRAAPQPSAGLQSLPQRPPRPAGGAGPARRAGRAARYRPVQPSTARRSAAQRPLVPLGYGPSAALGVPAAPNREGEGAAKEELWSVKDRPEHLRGRGGGAARLRAFAPPFWDPFPGSAAADGWGLSPSQSAPR